MSKIKNQTDSVSADTSTQVMEPSEESVRDYAYHLYQQGSCAPGHDLDNWLEAAACLKANIPAHHSHSRLHQHLAIAGKTSRV